MKKMLFGGGLRALVLVAVMLLVLFGRTAWAAPVVTAQSPADGATDVAVTTSLPAAFSEAMDPATITNGSFTLSQYVGIRSIAAGGKHSLALKNDGTVVSWGDNGRGQASVPAALAGVTAIAAGEMHSVALKSDRAVIAWGNNSYSEANVPAGLANVTAIAAGGNHTVAVKDDGTVVAWGRNDEGQTSLPGGLSAVRAIAAGQSHTVALRSDGTVVAWGRNVEGQITVPGGLDDVVAIAAGGNHTVALKSDGSVVAWGGNAYGQSAVPAGLSGVIAIEAGAYHTLALKNNGTVVAWGIYYQTALPEGLSGVIATSAGSTHSLALKNDGTVAAWGVNNDGQATVPALLSGVTAVAGGLSHLVALKNNGTLVAWGNNGYDVTTVPAGLSGVTAIASGASYNLALKSDGSVVAWGNNTYGQSIVPAGLSGVTAIASGHSHAVALRGDGTVVAWGNNGSGAATVPAELTGVIAIAAGDSHTVALKSNGTVVAWGYNRDGQTTVPAELSGVVAIAAGQSHTVALKSDGTVVAWGRNDFGAATVPAGLSGVVAIAVGPGSNHVVALKSDGTVVSWGANSYGQSTVPEGLDGVVAVAVGFKYSLAVKRDGTLVAWGSYPIFHQVDPYETAIAGEVEYDTSSDTARFIPAAPLAPNTTYTATVNTGARSANGAPLEADHSWSFTTASDTTPPVTTASPAPNTYTGNRSITLTCSDGDGSGCASTLYCLGTGCTPATPYSDPIYIDTSTILHVTSTDVAGNAEAVQSLPYTIIPIWPLVVRVEGAGAVHSSPGPDLACTGGCGANYPEGTTVTLTPSPAVGYSFAGWSGICTGTETCQVTMDAAKSVTATFEVTALPPVGSPTVVISQVFGGGGSVSSPYNCDFVELFNRGSASVNLGGWSLQYASAAGTGLFSQNGIALLSGTLAPGEYYLAQMSCTGTSNLPTSDVFANIVMSASAGKIALVSTTAGLACNGSSTPCNSDQLSRIVDLVGYGSANFFEGTAAAPLLSSTVAAFRIDGGCQDTDQNGTDFSAAPPMARNRQLGAINPCNSPVRPTVTPAAGLGGTISPAIPQAVTSGFTTSFTVTPDSGYLIASVTGCGGSLGGSTYTTGPIIADCTVVATFTPVRHTLTLTVAGSGTVHTSPGTDLACSDSCDHSYLEGATVTLTAEPSSGHRFVAWSGACSGTATCELTMSEARSVTATFAASSSGGDTFGETSETFDVFSGGWVGSQWQTGLPVVASAAVPGWTGSGVNPFHLVLKDGGQDGAVMLFDYSQVYTLDSGWAANQSGVTYEVSFEIGPTVWELSTQATQAGDGVRFEILRPDNSVLATYISYPAAWNGEQTFSSDSFQYVGDGSGDVRVRLSGVAPERFGGTVDNLQIGIAPAAFKIPKTGQTTSYAAGDDGDLQAGRAWPIPRFTDNGDQTMTDSLTGLIWTLDASTPGPPACGPGTAKTWQEALDYVACLNTSSYLGFTDWRLPNINEQKSLLNSGQANTSAWLTEQGFANVIGYYYWTSTTDAGNPILAWDVNLYDGDARSYYKTYSFNVWPVRGGASSLPQTGQTSCWNESGTLISCAGTGHDGELQSGVAWPNPRFADNLDETVTDHLTGLRWSRDANAPGPVACGPSTPRSWQGALDYVNCLNTNTYLGFTDWRLPNLNELKSLRNAEQPDNAAWLNGQGFTSVQAAYWSASTFAHFPDGAWGVGMTPGANAEGDKTKNNSVWPVRGPNSMVDTPDVVPTGTNVAVAPSPEIEVRFDTVSAAGSLTVTPLANPSPLANFRIVTGASYEITTTATYSGPVTVCLDYSDAALADKNNEPKIKLFHHDGSSWQDITTSVDTVNNRVCGVTDSFSPFVIAEPLVTYTITASANGTCSGTITPEGVTTVPAGGSQSYAFAPDPGCAVQNVMVNGFSQGAPGSYAFSDVRANQTLTVTFGTQFHTVTGSAEGNGSIGPNADRQYAHGTDVTVYLTPAAGHHVQDLLIDGVSVGAVSRHIIPAIDASHTAHAIFAPNPSYTLSASAIGSGTVTPSGATTVLGGMNQSYTFTPAAGYRVGSVVVNGVNKGAQTSWAFPNVTADHTLVVNFIPDDFVISATARTGGSISPAGTTAVARGGIQSYSFTPAVGYRVLNVSVNSVDMGALGSYTFTDVQSDQRIEVVFTPVSHTITASAGEGGIVSPAGSKEHTQGTSATYYVSPDAAHTIAEVRVDGVPVGAVKNYTFTAIDAPHTIEATFVAKPVWTITASTPGNGSVTPAGATSVVDGSYQQYTFTPAAGYRVGSVVVDGVDKGVHAGWTFSNVTADHSLVVNFAPDTFRISATAGANGSISPAGTTAVARGGNQSYTFTAAAGYRVLSVNVNSVDMGALGSYTFTDVQSDQRIEVLFTLVKHAITASSTAGGTISPAGTTEHYHGSTPSYYTTAEPGYRLRDILVDGVSVGAPRPYTFAALDRPHTIHAVFDNAPTWTLRASAGLGGTVTPSGDTVVFDGSSQSYSIVPAAGYVIASVVVDGVNLGALTSYTFSNVRANHTLVANFAVAPTVSGNGTLRLVWGDCDLHPGNKPAAGDWAKWTVRLGGSTGTVVASGKSALSNWSGINDITVPVSPTSYYVSIQWYWAEGAWEDETVFSSAPVTSNGQTVRLSY